MTRRTERVNNLIRREISQLLQRQAKDPRIGSFTTVTEVSTSLDLKYAKVFVSVMGSEEERRDTMEGLVAASGFFRRELAHRLKLRRVPELSFCRDDSIERGTHLLELMERISSANTADQG